MELDKDKIKQRFSEINEAITEAGRLANSSDNEFWSKKENIAALKYYLLQAIEATGGICVHIAAKKFNKGISSFGECFEILEKNENLNKQLTFQLQKMVKFRNKLIHRYWEIDDNQVLEYARNNLNDFNNFMKFIDSLL